MRTFRSLAGIVVALLATILVGCGGGGAGSTTTTTSTTTTSPPPPPSLTISTSSLPTAVQGLAYSATLSEQNGVAPFTWSVSSTTPLPAGLTLDASSGTIAGTPSTAGFAAVAFDLTDSSSPPKSAGSVLSLYVNQPLSVQTFNPSVSMVEYQSLFSALVNPTGGVPPYRYSISQGSLPAGMRMDPSSGIPTGGPITLGSFPVTVAVQDSYSSPEVATQPLTITVTLPPLQFVYSLNSLTLVANKPFTGNFYATGGTPPYTFKMSAGNLPPGLSLVDPATGLVTGTPTTAGVYGFTPMVTDSSFPPATAFGGAAITVIASPVGRNDSPAHATPIGNTQITFASISPLLDPTGAIAPDNDYYKLVALAGSTVHVETTAKRNNPNNPLDTVIEITDPNGARFTTGCNQPGGTTTNFSSPCLNDDISANPHIQDSSLDFKVPGTSGNQTFLLHVLDWSGNARPDMVYQLYISGVVNPLSFGNLPWGGVVGTPYSQTIYAAGGVGTITYSVASGALPPGLALASNGAITGTPTTVGKYSFVAQAADQGSPPQVASGSMIIGIANPLSITTTSIPNGSVGVPYSVQLTSTGGLGPVYWFSCGGGCYETWDGITLNSYGVLSGTPTQPGSHTFSIIAHDSGADPGGQNVSGTVTLTIN